LGVRMIVDVTIKQPLYSNGCAFGILLVGDRISDYYEKFWQGLTTGLWFRDRQ